MSFDVDEGGLYIHLVTNGWALLRILSGRQEVLDHVVKPNACPSDDSQRPASLDGGHHPEKIYYLKIVWIFPNGKGRINIVLTRELFVFAVWVLNKREYHLH